LVHAYGAVKLACLYANRDVGTIDRARFGHLQTACTELWEGRLDDHIVVDALQGGAGTSTNMNVNEVLARRAVTLAAAAGEELTVDPLAHVNLHQSTNDTYPTALRVAALDGLHILEERLVRLLAVLQEAEHRFADVVKMGRTQLQDAVLTTLGRSFGAWAEAIGRDRWRVSKCAERLRVVNLGGTAIGTGLGAPRRYIFAVTDHLRRLTGYPLSRAENLVDATQNHDALVEVSGILKATATTLVKIGGDLRLLASGPDAGLGELRLPALQAGSSIMPGKVNPVAPEAVIQAGLQVMGNDQVLSQAGAMGNLELNAFMPLIADRLLDSLDLLAAAAGILAERCLEGIDADRARIRAGVATATATITALAAELGYHQAETLAAQARSEGLPLRAVVLASNALDAATYDRLTSPDAVMRLGSPPTGGGG